MSMSKLTGSCCSSSEHVFPSNAFLLRLLFGYTFSSKFNKRMKLLCYFFIYFFHIWDTFLPSRRVSDYRLVWIPHASPNPVSGPPPPSPVPIRHQPPSGLTFPRSATSRCRHLQFPWAPLPHAPSLLSILMEWKRVWNPHWPSQKARATV